MARPSVATQKRLMTRKRLLVIGILSATIIVFVLFSSHGLLSRWRLTGERNDLVEDIDRLRASEDSLRTMIVNLKDDTLQIERLARERYGYIRPGERVYIIKRDSLEDNQ
jgi:cell division protein FtsB